MSFLLSGFDKKGRVKRGVSVDTLHNLECRACPLNKAEVNTPKMEPSGSDNPTVYFLAEAPGETEDREGEPLIGKSGQLLRKNIPNKWLKRIRYNNVIRTRPPKNRDPEWQEIECCRPSVVRDIEDTKPKAIFGLGNVSLKWATGQDTISLWRGKRMPIKVGNHVCWFYPTFHPAGLLRQRKNSEWGRQKETKSQNELVFEREIKRAFAEMDVLPEAVFEEPKWIYDGIQWVDGHGGEKDFRKLEGWLVKKSLEPLLAIDIETGSNEKLRNRKLRPYGEGARILTVAIGTHGDTFAFPIHHREAGWTEKQRDEVLDLLWWFLTESKCQKLAHSTPFELEWLCKEFGMGVLRASKWQDTMAQAYVLDSRKVAKKTLMGLDALCVIHFGLPLKSFHNLDMNNLDKEPLEDVLKYNGCDAKYCHKLFNAQRYDIVNQGLEQVYEDQLRRIPTIVATQLIGWQVDQDEVKKHQKWLGKEILRLEDSISDLEVVRDFEDDKRREFNPASTDDVAEIYVDYIKADEVIIEEDGKERYSTGKDILEKIDHPLSSLIISYRELTKVKSTYVDCLSLEDEGKFVYDDGKLHPKLNTMFVSTRRTSSDDPNGQNWPAHDEETKKIRTQIHVKDTTKLKRSMSLVKCDYGQIEARVIGMASKDEFLVKALWERYDIHQEWAERLAYAYPQHSMIGAKKFIKDKGVMKKFRQETKNNFVFPAFFNAGVYTIADYIHIPNDIIKKQLGDFWDTFPGVRTWQEKTIEFYNKYGYVELLTGFRRRAPFDVTKIVNTPIQGTASDIVIEAMNKCSEMAQDLDEWQFQPRKNIHDDLTFGLYDNSIENDLEDILEIMLKPEYSFINVPISVEVEAGKNWYAMEEVGNFFSDKW